MDEKLKMINALLSLETDDEVLPLEYDDSLSLYEFFAKFVHYIGKMIDDNTILEHLEDKRNPHGVTLEQLGVTAGTSDDVNKVIDMQVANTVYMAPNGYIGKPGFRRLDEKDLPSSITGAVKFLDGVTGNVQNQINSVAMELSNAVGGFGEHIGNRSNPHGVTIAQIGAAPSEYGLGTIATEILDANTAIKNGWYKLTSVNTSEAHIPFQYVVIHVTTYSDRYIIQDLYKTDVSGTHMQRVMYDGAWGEWVNVSPSAFAPSGYGYGGLSVRISGSVIFRSESELEDAIESVFSTLANGETKLIRFVGYPDNGDYSWFGILSKSSANYGSLFAHSAYNRGQMISKAKIGGVWEPLEWYNPPMVLGVEYRTTERWNGNPVYTMLINCGTMPTAGATIRTELPSSIYGHIDRMLRASGSDSDGNTIPYSWQGEYITEVSANRSAIYIYAKDDYSSNTAYVRVWYTKN